MSFEVLIVTVPLINKANAQAPGIKILVFWHECYLTAITKSEFEY
jgi:hypothetical protein